MCITLRDERRLPGYYLTVAKLEISIKLFPNRIDELVFMEI